MVEVIAAYENVVWFNIQMQDANRMQLLNRLNL